ncbi:M3 family oligoendopeptidase [Spirochaeta africana]|uniref:Oligoendopeptidase, pepF/M3 family n=1 Tax=Spirochaeta africana (strain ATCC 700263 / DSM 8902 / Z-7692) TaxID=889378 RepID=H9UFZ7_SPIAZ|nr:M3 family oligoendopeptidase [Spirochaeta africana]AFG36440.1 oligoendopeptidase, pepF/M3 family [Spirochaeta africana DSM 8902]
MSTGSGNLPTAPPQWDMSSIYPDQQSPAFLQDLHDYQALISQLQQLLETAETGQPDHHALLALIDTMNDCRILLENLESYGYCMFSAAADNPEYTRLLNRIELAALPFQNICVRFRNIIADISAQLPELYRVTPRLQDFRFYLEEQQLLQGYQLSPAEEDLAADLQRSGAEAWSRLQEQLSSTLSGSLPGPDGSATSCTVVQLRNMAHNRDRLTRQLAYEAELAAWETAAVPLAAALNGVKGSSLTLLQRRGYQDPLEPALQQARITPAALDAMITAMEHSLPQFHRYLQTKARILDLPGLAFYDLFAPVAAETTRWSYPDACRFIIDEFTGFSAELGGLARTALTAGWVDAEPRPGKVGGAFCIDLPKSGCSRILCNFEGSFSDVSTIAHELGHAYHSQVLRDLPPVLADYPMTLAETASIFCETLIFESRLQDATETQQLPLIEHFLQETTQMVVDILSRYYFEREVFQRRASGELGVQELCSIMQEAQRRCYGPGLDPESLHPYMWAVKGHYYIPGLSFYNFPYAFGLLFGLGLYQQYRHQPEGFPARYREILRATGRMNAAEVGRHAGIDIESPDFWLDSLQLIGHYIDRFDQQGGHP